MGRSIQSVEQYYDYGLRARVTESDRQKYFVDGLGKPEHVHVKDLDFFYALAKVEASRTWKERHAKGVPVIMDLHDMDQCFDKEDLVYGITAESVEEALKGGKPYVMFFDGDRKVASFRNFRYKQSWLDKKKSCSFPDCGADPDEGPYCCKSRLDKKGGERV